MKDKQDARSHHSKSSKLGKLVTRKRESRNESAVSKQPNINNTANVIESINRINDSVNATNEQVRESRNDLRSVTNGSGTNRNRVGRNSGDAGSNGSADYRTDSRDSDDGRNAGQTDDDRAKPQLATSGSIPIKKRGRRSKQQIIEDIAKEQNISVEEATAKLNEEKQTRKPRKVRLVEEDIEPGVTASVLMLGTIVEGASELIAMATNKPYTKLEKNEAFELSDAWLNCLDTMSKSKRKAWDRLTAKIQPWWNLGKVATKIVYPRYIYWQTEKEFIQNATASTQNETN